ncbi:alpha/beta hydrolase [Burkholderia dolosa]|uniref:alpha/beta fold hydrolase n=1 Tax=Burkholderia dolosa TaxID=152500 RepID=UPI001B994128|nr:alpha/beta hydrolase [Burkholderia dolosa]MBR8457073.1 alpha/beta hydrolase [Burkholderia dolosa]MDN7419428.1 alpha/beta hydrolase [Burkholderia dolosa]
MNPEFALTRYPLSVDGIALDISAIQRGGDKAPIVFLHGFGSTKEDYADIVRQPEFADHPFLAFDAPGCGETHCADLSRVSITFQVKTALAMVERIGFKRFHLVGHSMGALASLMLAHAHPDRVLSFVNIKGNLAPEDCFLSRQIFDHPQGDIERFFNDFIERTRLSPTYSSALYAASLRHKVRSEAIGGIFRSMVELSDHGALLEKFLGLPFPTMFMYGEQYASLSYLPQLRAHGVAVAEIAHCGHFPMYSDPQRMWQHIAWLHRQSAPS